MDNDEQADARRLALAQRTLAGLDGTDGQAVIEKLGALGRLLVTFTFGEVYSRGILTMRDRELITIGVLAALGGREPQLRTHLELGVKVGLSRRELEELLIQIVPYAGFPTAINAWRVLDGVGSTAEEAARAGGR